MSNQPTTPVTPPKSSSHGPDNVQPLSPSMPTNSQNAGIRRPPPPPPPPKPTNFQSFSVPPPTSPKPANLQNANVRLPPPPLPKPTNLKNTGIHPSPPPPPPMPVDFQNTNICTPPLPPPMPIDLQNNDVCSSPPNCLPEQMTNEPSTSSSNPQRGVLLQDICTFDKDNLKVCIFIIFSLLWSHLLICILASIRTVVSTEIKLCRDNS